MDVEAIERKEIQKKQRLVAALFVLALCLAMIFAYWMGAFGVGPSRKVFVLYNFAGGIERGSTVRLAGIKVGRVADIEFTGGTPGSETEAQLKLKIEVTRSAFAQITNDSKFYINLAGLIGERYVEIVPGSGTPAENKQLFRGVDPPRIDQLLSQGYGIFGDLRAFFNENKSDLKDIFNSLNQLSSNLSKILNGMSPTQKRQISDLIANLSIMSQDLKGAMSSLNRGAQYIESNGGKQAWNDIQNLLRKGDKITLQDIRKLMLEDGVKVNFSSKRIPTGVEQEIKNNEKEQR